jgi:hypothetical protein
MASKKTTSRGAGKGQKLLSGTRDQLIKDLQRVHKVFPTAVPDRDFYRQHGKRFSNSFHPKVSIYKVSALVSALEFGDYRSLF